MMKTFNWATLGCGVIANELAQAMQSRGQKLYSVANRTHEKRLLLPKSTVLKRFITALTSCLKMKMLILFTFLHRIIHIFLI